MRIESALYLESKIDEQSHRRYYYYYIREVRNCVIQNIDQQISSHDIQNIDHY